MFFLNKYELYVVVMPFGTFKEFSWTSCHQSCCDDSDTKVALREHEVINMPN